jgi:hypothetical protein
MKAKFVDKSINENIKFTGHEYARFNIKNGHVYASKEGILGDKETFISWNNIKEIMKKFNIL